MTDESPPTDDLEKARQADDELGDGQALELAVKKLIYGLAGDGIDAADCGFVEGTRRALHRVEVLEAENERLRDEVGQLQAQVDMLTEEYDTKDEKIRALVINAENRRESNQKAVILTARDIVGATGVSRRYAYDLIDTLPNEYEWILSREEARQDQYGHLEIDASEQTRAIAIHFEQLHTDPVSVNKFTTRTNREADES